MECSRKGEIERRNKKKKLRKNLTRKKMREMMR